jgi:hypothetical protein
LTAFQVFGVRRIGVCVERTSEIKKRKLKLETNNT